MQFDWIPKILRELRELVKETRRKPVPAMKTMLLTMVFVIALAGLSYSSVAAAPYYVMLVGSTLFIAILFFIVKGCIRINVELGKKRR